MGKHEAARRIGSGFGKRLTYANVVATLALFLGLSAGGVYAAGKISGGDIEENSITGKQVREQTLKGVDAGSVGGMRMKEIRYEKGIDDVGAYAPLLKLGGLEITAACRSFGDFFDVKASTTKEDARLAITAVSTGGADDTGGIVSGMANNGPAVDVDNVFPNSGDSMGTLQFVSTDGSVVLVNLALQEFIGGCRATGLAIG